MALIQTAHIHADSRDFAPTVLMPGDPKRAKFIAEEYLENVRLVNDVRGALGFTGTYRGTPVSVMASGMGNPSMGIYSYELFTRFNVQSIIRIGSAGGIAENVKVRDIVIAQGVSTDSNFSCAFNMPGAFAPLATFSLLEKANRIAGEKHLPVHIGNILSTDVFYPDIDSMTFEETPTYRWQKMGVLAVEMEAAALYMNAARLGKNALAIMTVSNHLVTGEDTTSEERRSTFRDMIELALETSMTL